MCKGFTFRLCHQWLTRVSCLTHYMYLVVTIYLQVGGSSAIKTLCFCDWVEGISLLLIWLETAFVTDLWCLTSKEVYEMPKSNPLENNLHSLKSSAWPNSDISRGFSITQNVNFFLSSHLLNNNPWKVPHIWNK